MVNTFLPYPDFRRSVAALDWRRLGKQRAEAKQILGALLGHTSGWRNTPMVRMWEGHEGSLALYGIRACEEWISRGYRDNTKRYFEEIIPPFDTCVPPWWMGMDRVHIAYQSNLIRKDPAYYGIQFPGVPPDLPYCWPRPLKETEQ